VRRLVLPLALVALALPAPAAASIAIATSAKQPTLKVDKAGNAEVAWRDARGLHSVLVRADGRLVRGGKVKVDVSRRSSVPLGLKVTARQTKDGKRYALQQWRNSRGKPELRFSRWTGMPTVLQAQAETTHVSGQVTFHGQAVFGPSVAAYVDAVLGTTRKRLGSADPDRFGTFTFEIPEAFISDRYNVTVLGKNTGWTLMPDAFAVVVSG
jgi:hypothetical protein